jgi:Uncharacterized protein conserved in bacteria (DUF2125)
MSAARTAMPFLLLALAASPLQAQTSTPDPELVKSSLEQIFSMATFGTVTLRENAEVSQSGADYRIRLPLAGFAAPPDPAVKLVAHSTEHGLLDVTSVIFPPAGTIESASADGPPTQITYSIGHQAITAKVDPNLTTPSSYEADLREVRLLSEHGDQHGEQTLDHYNLGGTLSTDAGGLLTLASQGSGTGFRFIGHGPNGFTSDAAARALAGHFSVEGLNRAQGTRLLTAFRGLSAVGTTPDQPPGLSPDRRLALRAIVEAANGLLNRIDAEEVLEDVRFAVGEGAAATNGTVHRLRVNMSGDALDERLSTQLGLTLEGISSSAVSAENVMFVPHRVDLRTVLAGLQIGPLKALLRAATEPGADPAVLQAQAMALFADPQARIRIEALSFDSGPLQIKGSAKITPGPDGQLGAEIHIAASGVDTLLAQAQSQPNLQRVMPMVFLAKGMGRPEGNNLIWDIRLGDGPLTINGMPFGQPAGKTR